MPQPGDSVKRRLQPEESDLFREAVGDVKPLRHDRHEPAPPRPPARARFARAERLAVLEESLQGAPDDPLLAAGDELVYRRPGVQDAVLRKLRRGQYRVQGEIDLHGLTVAQAKQTLREFLADALRCGAQCVRIVHGKGLRSGHRGPVVKNAVNSVLRRSGAVLAFVSARQVDGGTGAVYVLLSKTTA
jgi:DNA-nicking Smr family endonuclease